MSELAIRNSVATTLLTIAIILSGIIAFRLLPVAPLPEVEFPTIQVQATLPGASPETMASSVATPLERQFGRIAGLTEMTSTSTLGSTTIVMQFELSRGADAASRDVQAAINAARSQLPSNLPSNPTYKKVNPADAPIWIAALTSTTLTQGEMYDAASSILAQKLSQMQGVGQVFVGGSALPAVRVELNPTQLSNYGISLEQVRAILSSANVNRPKGEVANQNSVWALSSSDQLFKAKDYKQLIISYRNGSPVRLSDVGDVQRSVENVRNAGFADGVPAVLLVIFRQPGANIIETVDRLYAELPEMKASIPADMNLSVVLDRTVSIRASVHDVEVTLMISIGLVILVVFLFLGNLRATIIPGVVVPTSLIGTFGVMYLFGYSIDNLSLMALTISTGFVVDDAIVVVENISRYLEKGLSPFQAAIRGAGEIGFTVVSISTSLIAVFIPILLMAGIVGRLLREFAVTLSIAVVVSMFVSLTTTPMMCAKLFKRHRDAPPEPELQFDDPPAAERRKSFGEKAQTGNAAFDWLLGRYERSLSRVLQHPRLTLSVALATVGLSVFLYIQIPKGFFPQQDTGRLMGALMADQDTSFQALQDSLKRYVKEIKSDPAVDNVIAFAGGMGATNSGRMFIALKPFNERKISADMVIGRLRRKLSDISGGALYLQATQDLRIGGRQSNAQYQYTLQSDDLDALNQWAPRVQQMMRKLPLLTDVNSDQQNNGLDAKLAVDRPTASRLQITPRLIDNTLYDAFGQRQVSTMYTQLNQYHVVMEVAPEFWQSPDSLKQIYVQSASGSEVPLSAFTHFEAANTALAVNHQGQFPSVTIAFNLAPGVALGQAVEAIKDLARESGMPGSIQGMFSGTAQAFQDSLANESILIVAALIAVYIVLGILYESYIHPITIISTLPSAGVGALLALMICKTDLSIIALIGIILLIGIVKKNAIMMVDFALDAERNGGKEPLDAIYSACLLRFRPIMMTTMAALLGGLPLALGRGSGSELRRPLGIAIVGGLIVSQMLTLYTTPIIYLYLDRLSLHGGRFWSRAVGSLKRVPQPTNR